MAILIEGLKMPKRKNVMLCLYQAADGKFRLQERPGKRYGKVYDVQEVPDGHGRLIDADALEESLSEELLSNDKKHLESTWNDAVAVVFAAPTVIPAEPAEDYKSYGREFYSDELLRRTSDAMQ